MARFAVEIRREYRLQTIAENPSGILTFPSSSGWLVMNHAADAVTVLGSFVTDRIVEFLNDPAGLITISTRVRVPGL